MNEKLNAVLNNQKITKNRQSIYGVILNNELSMESLGESMHEKPYMQPPKAPVLYIKPQNTWVDSGAIVNLPNGEKGVEIGACLGVVIGEQNNNIAGYVCVADLSLPHTNYYRPAIREKCFDGSCVISDVVTASEVGNLEELLIKTYIDNQLVETRNLTQLIRPINELVNEVSEFITMVPGDILLTGVSYMAPIANCESVVEVKIDDVAAVKFHIKASQERKKL